VPYNRLISQLAHVEIFTPRIDESLHFWTQVLGLYETAREDKSVYLRAWGDPFHHSLILTEGEEPGLGHIGWRAAGPDQLALAVSRLESSGYGEGWFEDSTGHGAAYRYRNPGGHLQEIFWEVARYIAPPELRSCFPERVQKFAPRGAGVRMLDHVTVASPDILADVAFYVDTLGSRHSQSTVLEDDPESVIFATMTNTEKAHDLGILGDDPRNAGRMHHICYWFETSEDVFRAADLVMEAGYPLEFGPGRHGIGEMFYLYFREPGGMRVEIDSGGWRVYAPDEEPTIWTPSQGSNDFYRTATLPEAMTEVFPASGQRVVVPVGGAAI
jgi:catechol 2,3-dioxygenase